MGLDLAAVEKADEHNDEDRQGDFSDFGVNGRVLLRCGRAVAGDCDNAGRSELNGIGISLKALFQLGLDLVID